MSATDVTIEAGYESSDDEPVLVVDNLQGEFRTREGVAKAVNAATLERSEQVIIVDRSGAQLRATVPALLLSAELFPDNLDELVL